MVDRGWGSAALSLEHSNSNGSSLVHDTPTRHLLDSGDRRTSSGWAEDDNAPPLPDPHNRTPVAPRSVSMPAALHSQPQRPPPLQPAMSWSERHLAQQQREQAAGRAQPPLPQPQAVLQRQTSWQQYQQQAAAAAAAREAQEQRLLQQQRQKQQQQRQKQQQQPSLQRHSSWQQQHLPRQQQAASVRDARRQALPAVATHQQHGTPFEQRPQQGGVAGHLQRLAHSWQPAEADAADLAELKGNEDWSFSAPEITDYRRRQQPPPPSAETRAALRTAGDSNASTRVRHTSDRVSSMAWNPTAFALVFG